MIDEAYRNSFKEVYDVLRNTEDELISKIPVKFISFIKDNMNYNYKTNIQQNVHIDKQPLLKETEAILSLIYRSYWATEEEKQEFTIKDQQEFHKKQGQGKNIEQVFAERKKINNITIDNNLMVIKKESLIKRFFDKVLRILKK